MSASAFRHANAVTLLPLVGGVRPSGTQPAGDALVSSAESVTIVRETLVG